MKIGVVRSSPVTNQTTTTKHRASRVDNDPGLDMSRFARKGKAPKGFEEIEQTLAALETELRDQVTEKHATARHMPHHTYRTAHHRWLHYRR